MESDGAGNGKGDSTAGDAVEHILDTLDIPGFVVVLSTSPEMARRSSVMSANLACCQPSIHEAIEQGHKPQAWHPKQSLGQQAQSIHIHDRQSSFSLISRSTNGPSFPAKVGKV